MSPTAKSIFYYSFYMFGMGLGLFLVPNLILGLLCFAPTTDIWIRMLGRLSFCTVLLVIFVPAPPTLALVGSVDLVGAIWTGWTLRRG